MLSLSKMYQSDLNLQKNNSANNINVGQSVEPQLINYSELYKGFSSTSINLLNMSNKFNESDIFEDKEFCQEYSKILEDVKRASVIQNKNILTDKQLKLKATGLIEAKRDKISEEFGKLGLEELKTAINSNNGTILNSYIDSIESL